jgi:FtsP/CotA-like multicopper oxidase with cupredoxin domain
MKIGLFGSAALALPAERVARTKLSLKNRIAASKLPKPFSVPFTTPNVLAPVRRGDGYDCYSLDQMQVQAEILPGLKTTVWGYNGEVPGPTIVTHRNRPVVVRQCNMLPDYHPTLRYKPWTSTHLHGSASLPQYDGYASDVTNPNCYKDYRYPNFQNARTLWYHDHGIHITAPNAYMGLAGMYLLHDDHELSLPIPHGRYDVPLILKDAMFQKSGDLIYEDNSESGVFGDVILVNGRPWPKMRVERRKYRFRLLNASISRSYELSLSNGQPLHVIGTDGGLMAKPFATKSLRHGMAERYEVIIDFARCKLGERVVLRNKSPKNNIDFDNTNVVMAFDVVSESTDPDDNEIPEVINPGNEVMALQPSASVKTRRMDFERKNGHWTINGETWAEVINSGYEHVIANPGLGDTEIWELRNRSGGWFHPVHIHLIDFKVLDRNGRAPFGYENGPKDVVYVGENETVRVLMKFGPHRGKYMIHCHNLVHEDHDMMAQFSVGLSGGDDPNDPIKADGARPMPAPEM